MDYGLCVTNYSLSNTNYWGLKTVVFTEVSCDGAGDQPNSWANYRHCLSISLYRLSVSYGTFAFPSLTHLYTVRAKIQEYLNSWLRLGWLINSPTQQVEVYRPKTALEVLHEPASLSGDAVLVGFVL